MASIGPGVMNSKHHRISMTPTQTLTERLQTVYEIRADTATIHHLPALVELVLLRIQSDLRFQEASL